MLFTIIAQMDQVFSWKKNNKTFKKYWKSKGILLVQGNHDPS